MSTRLEGFLEDLSQVEGLDEIQSVVSGLRDLYEVEHVVYHARSGVGEHFVALTYPEAWVARYVEANYIRLDPVVRGCQERFHPVDWRTLDWSGRPVQQFLAEAMEHGVGGQGFSVPIRGPNGQFAMFSFNADCSEEAWEAFTTENVRDLILAGHYLNHRALELGAASDVQDVRQPLSPREIDVLTLLALGYSRAQAAESLSISEHTLRVYVDTARHKLGAANTTHAVAKAVARGLITF